MYPYASYKYYFVALSIALRYTPKLFNLCISIAVSLDFNNTNNKRQISKLPIGPAPSKNYCNLLSWPMYLEVYD